MDGWHLIALLSSTGLGSIGYVVRQWRLRKRDHDDYLLRRAVLEANPKAPVLANLPELRRAERQRIRLSAPRSRRKTTAVSGKN